MMCKALAFASLIFTGCTLIPQYQRPAAPVDASWPQGPAYTQDSAAGSVDAISWKEFFRSEHMQSVIQTALDNNRDLRIATLNIEVACAAYRARASELFPYLSATSSYMYQRFPKGISGGVSGDLAQELPDGLSEGIESHKRSVTIKEYTLGFGTAAYELDLFGQIRSLKQRELEKYFASQEARTSTQIALIGEVANAYLTYLADKKLLRLTEETLASQQAAYDLVKKSFDLGTATLLDVAQAATTVETARANQFLYTRMVAQDTNALVLLMGTSSDVAALEGVTLSDVRVMQDLPVGLSSSVLLCRPDIRRAEYELQAANANIGAARAAFFPSIALTASIGNASDRLKDLFRYGAGSSWSFAGDLTQPIFEGGRLVADLDNAKAREKIAVAEYERAIQEAFCEVADELAARGTYTKQLEAQRALVAANQQSYDLAVQSYKNGVTSFLDVLDSQQTLYSAQQDEIVLQQQTLGNMITLYKVLGGGQQ